MVRTQKRIRTQALKLSIAAVMFGSLGAAVVAAPFAFTPRAALAGAAIATQPTTLVPLTSGPAIQLARAGDGENEDCVRVTKMTGPNGKVYPTRGMVCGGE